MAHDGALRLENNRRASLFGMTIPLSVAVLAIGLYVAAGDVSESWRSSVIAMAGLLGVAVVGLVIAVGLWSLLPRIEYRNGKLLVRLRLGPPAAIPIDHVECFFLGQGPGEGDFGGRSRPEAVNLIVRIAERAVDWHQGEAWPPLASWCDGYVTVRGMWCEPLTVSRIEQLNRQLVAIHRALRAEATAAVGHGTTE